MYLSYIVYVNARMPRVPQYSVEKYTYLKQTPEGDEQLEAYLRKQDWKTIINPVHTADQMVQNLHDIFEKGMQDCYERKVSVKKTSEPPWMTNGIRRLIKRRRAVFRKFGRNVVWKNLKKKTKKLIRDSCNGYNKKKEDSILAGGSNKFHECVKAFVNNEKKKEWNPRQLYPNASEKEAAENLATYFNNISNGI